MGLLGGFNAVFTVLSAILGLCAWSIFSLDMKFGKVTVDDLISSSVLTNQTLFLTRICCGIVIWSTCIHILVDRTGITLRIPTPYGRPKVLSFEAFGEIFSFHAMVMGNASLVLRSYYVTLLCVRNSARDLGRPSIWSETVLADDCLRPLDYVRAVRHHGIPSYYDCVFCLNPRNRK